MILNLNRGSEPKVGGAKRKVKSSPYNYKFLNSLILDYYKTISERLLVRKMEEKSTM